MAIFFSQIDNISEENVPKRKGEFRVPALIALLAVAVRWAHVASLALNDPAFTHPFMDMRWHVEWARAMAMGAWKPEPFFRAPLYPFFIGALFAVFGPNSLLAIRLTQGVLGALGCVVIWALGNRLGGQKTAIVSGLIAALYGPLIYFDGDFLIPVLYLPLAGLSLLLLISAVKATQARKSSLPKWSAAGLAAGFAAIAIPNILVFIPGVLVWVLLEIPDWKRRIATFAIWVAFFSIPVGAVTAYNAELGAGFVPVASQGGINFWIGNNPDADGKTAMAPTHFGASSQANSLYHDSVRVNSTLEAQRRLGRVLRDDQVSSYWFGQAFRFIRNEPRQWIKLMLYKTYFLINGYELPSNRDIYSVRKFSPPMKILLWKKPLFFPFGLIFPLALAGMVLALKNPTADRATHRLLFIYVVIYGVSVIAFFVTSRHRLPIVPPLIPYAAFALTSISERIAGIRRRGIPISFKTAAGILVFLAGFFLSNTKYFGIQKVPERENYMNMGFVYIAEKRYDEALAEFRAALEEDPLLDRAMFNIGATYLLMRRFNEAEQVFHDTIKINPQFVDAWVHLANVYFEQGKLDEAEKTYRKALSINPNNPLAHYNLALLLKRKGDMDGYIRELLASNRSDPSFAPANVDLAYLLIQQGKYDEARALLQKAIVVNPDDPDIKTLLEIISKARR